MTTGGPNVVSAFIDKHTVPQDGTDLGFMNQSAYSLRFTITSSLFPSFGTRRTSLSVNNIISHSVFVQLYFHGFRACVGDVFVIFNLSVQALGHSCRW